MCVLVLLGIAGIAVSVGIGIAGIAVSVGIGIAGIALSVGIGIVCRHHRLFLSSLCPALSFIM